MDKQKIEDIKKKLSYIILCASELHDEVEELFG